jgi:hypothetical protein
LTLHKHGASADSGFIAAPVVGDRASEAVMDSAVRVATPVFDPQRFWSVQRQP